MFVLSILIHASLLILTLGSDFCSRNQTDVKCVPCSELCPVTERPCNSTRFFCPKQCGNTIAASDCGDVCDANCVGGRCEYTNNQLVLNCSGCKPEWTGQRCQELCPTNCYKCHQFNSTCITCQVNYRPPDCTEIISPTVTPTILTTTADSLYNCSINCISFNYTPVVCIKCSFGYYGNTCETVCTHCNASLCAMDMNCKWCVGNLSSSECVTEPWTEYKTTTKSWLRKEKIDHRDGIVILTCGIIAVLLLTVGILGTWRKLVKK